MSRKGLLIIASMLMLSSLLIAPSCAKNIETGDVLLCSSSEDGEIGNSSSVFPSISGDGRYVAFASLATNLIPDVSKHSWDIYRKDLETGEVLLCSSSASGEPGNSDSDNPAISGDGRYVAFESMASNLVPDDDNDSRDIFRKDLTTGEIERCSSSSSGVQGDGHSYRASINSDGRYVAFHSFAENLVPEEFYKTEDQRRRYNVFRKDLDSGELTCCSTNSSGEIGNGDSQDASINADGTYVAFESNAKTFIPGEEYMLNKVYRKDLTTGDLILCSVSVDGVAVNDSSGLPKLSADGRYVAFESYASNLVPETIGAQGRLSRVYRKDISTGEIVCCSTTSNGELGVGHAGFSSISGDGRYVTFYTNADNLKGANRGIQVLRKDLVTGEIVCCSSSSKGKAGNSNSSESSLSADGRYVAFSSLATNLVSADENYEDNIYRKELTIGESVSQ